MSSKRTLPTANVPKPSTDKPVRRLTVSSRTILIGCFVLAVASIFGIGYMIGRARGRQARPVKEISLPTPNAAQNGLADVLTLGTVKSIDSSSLVLQGSDGTQTTVKLDDTTRFSRKGKTLQLADVKLESRVSIFRANQEAVAKQVVLP